MRIVFINPDTGGRHRLMLPVPPLGLASLAAVAKERGHHVEVWDQFAYPESSDSLTDRLLHHKADLVGISCLTPAEPTSRRIIELYRKKGGKGLTVLGSVHPTVFHEELIRSDACDLIVRREGEGPFADLLDALVAGAALDSVRGITFRNGEEVVVTEDHDLVRDIETLPFPAWEATAGGIAVYSQVPTLGLHGLTLPILGSRGCPKRCSFCGQDIFHRGMRVRSVDHIIDEAAYLKERFGIKYFVFLDANFPMSRKYGLRFCRRMIERGLHEKLKWSTEISVNIVDRELLSKMAEAGCVNIEYGFEVGSQDILNATKKGTDLSMALNAMRWTKEAGIHTFGLFMIGLPGERPRHVLRTLRFAMKLDCNVVKFNIAIPYPGCELFDQHRDELLRNFDPETYNSWFQSSDPSRIVTIVPGGMSSNTQLLLQRLMLLVYYLRLRIVWKHIRKKTLIPSDYVEGARFLFGGLAEALWKNLYSLFRPSRNGVKKESSVS